ncbi:transcript variant X3 [Nothobranchius furzeri]|uniref:Transcript variant X3 n=1 Tax=Nothobranchius furzeri TaxID=105023 RepID=A0A9D2XJN6_NOTFU|nr:transcript variant X3 [Nothobranchius furzeri]
MAPFPDEVDVFTGPHWRMKQLVGLYCEKLSQTNFSNNNDFRSFLTSLCATFKEFKMHEQIENEYIIGLLQQRCCTAYNVHSDNKLSEMLSLFEKGLQSVKSEYEQLNYAQQLKERLEAFTQDFLPHMKEEEEVFQPMLMQYLTYDELKDLKKQVIAQHCNQQQCESAAEVLKGFRLWTQAEELQKAFKYADHEKTDYGDYYNGPPGDLDHEPDEEWVKSRQNEVQAFQEWDEDADVDESDVSGPTEGSLAISTARREKRLLNGIIQNLLPAIGASVKSVILAYSSTVSSKMIRQIIHLCPNITHLDLTQTDVTDFAFDSWSHLGACHSLEHLDLSGCEKITDHTLKKLAVGMENITFSTCSEKHADRRATLPKSSPIPIRLMDERNLQTVRRKRQAIIFKHGTSRWGTACIPTQVWVVDTSDLADIEDAAEWSHRGGVTLTERFSETQLVGGSCCCRRSTRHRTRSDSSYLHRQYAMSGEVFCGHSTCCSSDFRTFTGPQNGPGTAELWTTCSPLGRQQCLEPENRTECSKAKRSLKFLSLSGCYQITDLGLRSLSQHGGLPVLEHLNLSGCLFITEVGLQELVSACPSLSDEHFYYCDNINGNTSRTAGGCLFCPFGSSPHLIMELCKCLPVRLHD